MKYGLPADGPLVSAIWFSDPDGTAHAEGIGSPLAMQSIIEVDAQFGRIIDSLDSRGLTNRFNIIISTDHGFVTNTGKHNLVDFLIGQGLKEGKESDDVVVAEGAIYVKDHDEKKIKKIVSLLQAQEWVGPIFTKALKKGALKGKIEGTLSFDVIHWNHPERAADILMDENWDDRSNSFGFKGTSLSRGVAGHGGASPYEIHIPLLLGGPAFKKNFESELPTSNVDITPTVLYLCNIPVPASVDGRVLSEMMGNPLPVQAARVQKQVITTAAKYDGGTYTLTIERSILGNNQYVNFTKVARTPHLAVKQDNKKSSR
jgi:arylsulfatase A-like enzyme